MRSVVKLSVILLSVIMMAVNLLSVIMLGVVILNVVASTSRCLRHFREKFRQRKPNFKAKFVVEVVVVVYSVNI